MAEVAVRCEACQGVEGAQHTCPGSGTFLAAEGHDAGDVIDVLELPRFNVQLQLVCRGLDEADARTHLTGFVSELLADDLVDWVDFTVEARP